METTLKKLESTGVIQTLLDVCPTQQPPNISRRVTIEESTRQWWHFNSGAKFSWPIIKKVLNYFLKRYFSNPSSARYMDPKDIDNFNEFMGNQETGFIVSNQDMLSSMSWPTII